LGGGANPPPWLKRKGDSQEDENEGSARTPHEGEASKRTTSVKPSKKGKGEGRKKPLKATLRLKSPPGKVGTQSPKQRQVWGEKRGDGIEPEPWKHLQKKKRGNLQKKNPSHPILPIKRGRGAEQKETCPRGKKKKKTKKKIRLLKSERHQDRRKKWDAPMPAPHPVTSATK